MEQSEDQIKSKHEPLETDKVDWMKELGDANRPGKTTANEAPLAEIAWQSIESIKPIRSLDDPSRQKPGSDQTRLAAHAKLIQDVVKERRRLEILEFNSDLNPQQKNELKQLKAVLKAERQERVERLQLEAKLRPVENGKGGDFTQGYCQRQIMKLLDTRIPSLNASPSELGFIVVPMPKHSANDHAGMDLILLDKNSGTWIFLDPTQVSVDSERKGDLPELHKDGVIEVDPSWSEETKTSKIREAFWRNCQRLKRGMEGLPSVEEIDILDCFLQQVPKSESHLGRLNFKERSQAIEAMQDPAQRLREADLYSDELSAMHKSISKISIQLKERAEYLRQTEMPSNKLSHYAEYLEFNKAFAFAKQLERIKKIETIAENILQPPTRSMQIPSPNERVTKTPAERQRPEEIRAEGSRLFCKPKELVSKEPVHLPKMEIVSENKVALAKHEQLAGSKARTTKLLEEHEKNRTREQEAAKTEGLKNPSAEKLATGVAVLAIAAEFFHLYLDERTRSRAGMEHREISARGQ